MASRTGSGEPLWHLLIDMYDRGTERHTRMRLAIEQHGRELPRRPLFGARTVPEISEASVDKRIRTRALALANWAR